MNFFINNKKIVSKFLSITYNIRNEKHINIFTKTDHVFDSQKELFSNTNFGQYKY